MDFLRKFLLLFLFVSAAVSVCRAQGGQRTDGRFFVEKPPRARMDMGVAVGATYMPMSGGGDVSLTPKLGVRGALTMSLYWRDRYGVQMELGYLFNKIKAERGSAAYDVRSNVMEIPVLFLFRGPGPLRLSAGPVLSLAGTGRYDAGEERVEFGRLRTTAGYAAGVGVAMSRHVSLDVRYTGSFGRTDNYFEGAEFSCGSSWLSLSLGYVF